MRCHIRRLSWLLVPLVMTAGLSVTSADSAAAADPDYPAASTDPVASYGEPPAGQVVTDVKVVTGTDSAITCPAGYTKRFPDLNRGLGVQLNGKLSDYVFTCLLFAPQTSLTDANPGIGELYVSSPTYANCGGSDTKIPGNLNSGQILFNATRQNFEMFYCLHRPNTNGGSGHTVNPGVGVDFFATPRKSVLRDIQFLAWDLGHIPACDTNDCVDTSPVGAFGYLEAAKTYEPYCAQYFGPDYHPMFKPWEYHTYSGDKYANVPQDADAADLNTGNLFNTSIIGCVAYVSAVMPNAVTLTTPPARVGQTVDLKALVDPTDGGGTVRFLSDGVTIPGCDALGFGSGGLLTWQAICSTHSLPAGTHTIAAVYSGDSHYMSSVGFGQEAVGAPTTTTFSFTGTAKAASIVNLKALVEPTDGAGTVRFTSDGWPIPGCDGVPFGSGGGTTWQAICSTPALGQGTHTITATYSGDSGYAGSTTAAPLTVVPNTALKSVRLVSGANNAMTLAVAGGSTDPGARVVQSPSRGQADDVWAIAKLGAYVELINANSGMCLTTDGVAGHPLYQTSCVGSATQLWELPSTFGTGFTPIRHPGTGNYLEIFGGSAEDGAAVDSWPYNGGYPNQTFAVAYV